ncbi:hypothetical protein ACPXB5_11275 [Micromonospora arida]|uniref:hypothetical protein n=1 Tax=Micromonospora arida TaxID=2203715 RepID=UPI003CF94068
MPDAPNTDASTDAGNGDTSGSTAKPATGKAPDWDGPYDEERAAKLIENLRGELDAVRGKLKTREDAEKTELQRAQEAAAEARREATQARQEAARTAAIAKHGLTDADAEWLRGESAEEIEASAAKLAARFAPPATEEPTTDARPKPRLVPGHSAADSGGDDFDPMAAAVAATSY